MAGFFRGDDGKGSAEIVVFNEVFEQSRAMLREDALVVVEVKVTQRMGDDGEVTGLRILAEQVYDLAAVRKRWGRRLKVSCNGNATAERLETILAPFRADGLPVVVHYVNGAFGPGPVSSIGVSQGHLHGRRGARLVATSPGGSRCRPCREGRRSPSGRSR